MVPTGLSLSGTDYTVIQKMERANKKERKKERSKGKQGYSKGQVLFCVRTYCGTQVHDIQVGLTVAHRYMTDR